MKSPTLSAAEHLESRTLFSAQTYMSGKTLEVLGDPQFKNFIDVEYADASKTAIIVEIFPVTDPAAAPTSNFSDVYGTFLASDVKKVFVLGGSADDQIKVGDTSAINNQPLGFNINTRIDTGDGNNSVFTGDETVTVTGGAGNDTIFCGNGNDILRGEGGDDNLSAGNGKDMISGGAGNDWIIGGEGRETISGGAGNDRIGVQDLANGGDLIFGGAGDDSIVAANGNDTIWGGAGNDNMYAGSGKVIFGVGLGTDTAYNSDGQATFYAHHFDGQGTDYLPGVDKVVNTISKNETRDPVI